VLRWTFTAFMWPLLALRESFYLSVQMTFCGFVLAYFIATILNVASNIKIENNKMYAENLLPKSHVDQCAVELQLPGSPVIRIGLALRVNLSRILQN